MPVTGARPRRAAPLPPDERRHAILRAVLPVVRARGGDVTTRELAEAAGVAEGTLFRVFDDKETLVREAIVAALDPGEFVAELGAIELDRPLEERLDEAIRLGVARLEDLALWMSLLHRLRRGPEGPGGHPERGGHPGHARRGPGPPEGWTERQQAAQLLVRKQLRRILEPDTARFRYPIDAVIVMLEAMLTGAIMHSADRLRQRLETRAADPNLVVDFFLHGALRPDVPTH